MGERGQRLAHRAVGAHETKLEGAARILLQGRASDVKALTFDDGADRGLGGRVEPELGSQEVHCRSRFVH